MSYLKFNEQLDRSHLSYAVLGYLGKRQFDGNISAYVPLTRFAPGFTYHLVHALLSTVFLFEAFSLSIHISRGFISINYFLIMLSEQLWSPL